MSSVTSSKGITIAVLGCGFMGTALLKGILSATQSDHGPISKYIACVQSEASLARVHQELSVYDDRVEFVRNDNSHAVEAAQVIILAVPPGNLDQVLRGDGMPAALRGKFIISIVAGKSIREIGDSMGLPRHSIDPVTTDITRVIPSIGAQINESMSLVASTPISNERRDLLEWMFTQVGKVEFVDEALLNTATAVSASCHALIASAMDAVVDASVAEGIPRAAAIGIAAQCMRSSASLLLDGMTIEEFKASMSVPYGITINASLQLDRGGLRPAISDAVRSAAKYANDMK